ncbi:hypothetical protein GCM10009839_37330 [Catenulispora yoronensis]|uniref:Uncharacterized protein n=1 Tax=Catenulispora yoronensis TaxID=450799 RepID=A0ABP5FYK9_9ACTN
MSVFEGSLLTMGETTGSNSAPTATTTIPNTPSTTADRRKVMVLLGALEGLGRLAAKVSVSVDSA